MDLIEKTTPYEQSNMSSKVKTQQIINDDCVKKMQEMECYKCILDCSDENVAFYEKSGFNRKGSFMTTYFE